MTVYARNDVCAVVISTTHGGCGTAHSRPVVEGAPVKHWELTCHGGCEDYLRHDPLWSATPQNVPETPDETDARLDAEKRGQMESLARTARNEVRSAEALEALVKLLAGREAPATPPAAPQAAVDAPADVHEPVELDLDGMSFDALKQLAVELDVKVARSKAEQVKVIRKALDRQLA